MNDLELLREYASQDSEDAFATVVNRYVRLVYSAALRQCGHVQDAEEITQAVFVILARKAAGLGQDTVLPGWLLRTTRFVAMNALRRKRHRLLIDFEETNANQAGADAAWQRLAPMLDEALERLSVKDRDAVVLRYFEQRSFKEIARLTAATEDGAQKRVTRAVEKLRLHFQRRGLVLTSATIFTAITANAVQAAPAPLTATVLTAATSGTALTGSVAALVKASLAALNAARLKTLGLWATTVALLPVACYLVAVSLREKPLGIPVNPATLPWRSIAASADGNKLVATVSSVGLIYSSTDSGTNWTATSAPIGLWNALACSADGTRLVALGSDYSYVTNGYDVYTFATNSRIYFSANGGASWTEARGNPTEVTVVNWACAASSADGFKLAACSYGRIYTSTNGGRTWTLRNTLQKQWNSIASSVDGTRLVAVAVKGGIYTSADSGVTWTPSSAPSDLWWWSVGSSADGSRLVAAATYNAQATAGVPIYVSADSGTNWLATSSPSNRWLSVASSADGITLVAAAAFTSPAEPVGPVCISRDSGATWTTTNAPGANWNCCVAVSADGNKIFAGMNSGGIKVIAR